MRRKLANDYFNSVFIPSILWSISSILVFILFSISSILVFILCSISSIFWSILSIFSARLTTYLARIALFQHKMWMTTFLALQNLFKISRFFPCNWFTNWSLVNCLAKIKKTTGKFTQFFFVCSLKSSSNLVPAFSSKTRVPTFFDRCYVKLVIKFWNLSSWIIHIFLIISAVFLVSKSFSIEFSFSFSFSFSFPFLYCFYLNILVFIYPQ